MNWTCSSSRSPFTTITVDQNISRYRPTHLICCSNDASACCQARSLFRAPGYFRIQRKLVTLRRFLSGFCSRPDLWTWLERRQKSEQFKFRLQGGKPLIPRFLTFVVWQDCDSLDFPILTYMLNDLFMCIVLEQIQYPSPSIATIVFNGLFWLITNI
jgi:hypothetical protein